MIDPPPDPGRRYADPSATPDQRTYATLMHVSIFAVHFGIPPGVVPLVMWLIRRKDSGYIDDHGKEALNFQLSLLIYGVIVLILAVPLTAIIIGIPLVILSWVAIYLLGIVGGILAALAANRGEYYRYPMTLRLIA